MKEIHAKIFIRKPREDVIVNEVKLLVLHT